MKYLKDEDYARIESQIALKGEEDYVVVAQKRHNKLTFSIHVFERQATTKELIEYEETASRMRFKGSRAEIEGSQVLAAKNLYNKLIARAYDVQVGRTLIPTLDREKACEMAPPLVKRAAVREFMGTVTGASDLAEDEGETVTTNRDEED